jgi:2,3-bisphosphoglycerate-independent phosphoglycerate mutase
MTDAKTPRPVVLCILDGWGERAPAPDNAIALAETPVWDRFKAACPHSRLDASAEEVGLPAGQMGNSEVGHMNLGAGRAVLQDLPRIDAAIAAGELDGVAALGDFIAALKASGGTAHLMGLMSPGGVHSHQDHIVALAEILSAAGLDVAVHVFLDGRDTPPRSGRDYLARFIDRTAHLKRLRIATIGGRYYAMDRDKRWDRVARAYDAIVAGQGAPADDPIAAVEASYATDTGDEFVVPTVIGDYPGTADGDGILMANFRADRARQILAALVDADFAGFARNKVAAFAAAAGLIDYGAALRPLISALFRPEAPTETLGEIVAAAGRRQLRIAETEKYAHVTFFFNGGREDPFPGEERILVPSPQVATYDLQPQMSAPEVTDRLCAAIAGDEFDLIVANYANADMVGHSGDLDAAIAAVEAVDNCLGRIATAVEAAGGALLITADHGNVELMRDGDSGGAHTAHSHNPVPCILVNGPATVRRLAPGRLADIAPTVLALMGLAQPAAMSGRSLLVGADRQTMAGAAA